MKNGFVTIFILLFAILSSCCEKENDTIPVSTKRTVLVYLGVDNNFRDEVDKIEELRDNWNKRFDGNLLVYADAGNRPALIHIYHTARRGNVADTLEIYPPENSASPETFTRIMNRVKQYRPAASYGLVVLSHGSGWLPAEMSKPSPSLRSVIWDMGAAEDNNYMELAGFAEAIPYKLDFIIFDACFMGAVEVGYELKDKVDYVVASPAEVLSPGFVYASMMKHLFRPEADLKSVAREFYEYSNAQSGLFRSATVSVLKTAGLENLADVCQNILDQNATLENVQGLQTFGYGAQKIYFDLEDYMKKIASEEQYADFQEALNNRCILYKACTDSYYSDGTKTLQPIRTFSGLSAYIPQASYPEANEYYKNLKWGRRVSGRR